MNLQGTVGPMSGPVYVCSVSDIGPATRRVSNALRARHGEGMKKVQRFFCGMPFRGRFQPANIWEKSFLYNNVC